MTVQSQIENLKAGCLIKTAKFGSSYWRISLVLSVDNLQKMSDWRSEKFWLIKIFELSSEHNMKEIALYASDKLQIVKG